MSELIWVYPYPNGSMKPDIHMDMMTQLSKRILVMFAPKDISWDSWPNATIQFFHKPFYWNHSLSPWVHEGTLVLYTPPTFSWLRHNGNRLPDILHVPTHSPQSQDMEWADEQWSGIVALLDDSRVKHESFDQYPPQPKTTSIHAPRNSEETYITPFLLE